MSTFTLVRHGQATPFEQDTDRLSEVGERQAGTLARFWLGRNVTFDEAYCGGLVRQRRTAEIVARTFREAGRDFPELQVDERLNEYGAEGILKVLAPQLSLASSEFRELMRASEAAAQTPDRNRHFQKMLEALMDHWLGGEYALPEVESWQEFSERTRAALQGILRASSSSRRIAAFTSGGVIGRAVQLALDAPDATALKLNWRVKNASRTEFTFSYDQRRADEDTRNGGPPRRAETFGGARLSLDAFNVTDHLPPELVTFR